MNRYHETHKDPEIKAKFESWQKAHDNYRARAAGFKTADEMKATKERKKSEQKFTEMLKGIGANAAYKASQAIKKVANKAAQKMRRTGSNRGS